MTTYFECLACGAITSFEVPPPKCGRCGCGTGITRHGNPALDNKPDEAAAAPAPDPIQALRQAIAGDRAINLMASNPELLMLEERCIDGEARGEQRAEAARRRGDFAAAAFEAQLREQYRRLRLKMRDRRNHDKRPDLAPGAPRAQALRGGGAAQPPSRDEE